MNTPFDTRITPARADLAALSLKGKIDAKAFVDGTPARVSTDLAPLYRLPDDKAPRETEMLFGETLHIYENKDGWAWVQAEYDGYVGYTRSQNLSDAKSKSSHYVSVLRTFVFNEANIKSRPNHLVSLNSKLIVEDEKDRFSKVANHGYIITDHIKPINDYAKDFVGVAEKFLGTPYLWGGRTSLGLDCSALVQNALARCGISAPRDTDMQEAQLGHKIAGSLTDTALKRGDLIFWKGHVGIMQNSETLLHANGTWMYTSLDNVHEFADRVLKETGPVTSVKRL